MKQVEPATFIKKLFSGIIAVYITYPVIYLGGFSSFFGYPIINNIERIINILWIAVGALSVTIIFYAIQFRKKDLISRNKAVTYAASAILLLALFKIYPIIVMFVDFGINGFRGGF